MLSFLSPWFLVGALTAAVPIVLHLLKRDPEPRVRFAAVKLLKDAPVEYTDTRRIRELLLLALRVFALVLLALAFARPFLASGAAMGGGVTIVALDTSYSMSGPGAFDRARLLARAAVNRTPPGDLVGVVTFSDLPTLAAPPAADRGFALSALDAATPGFGATRYRGALGAAVQALAGRRGTIILVTDLQESGWDAGDRASVPESAQIEIADVGAPPANLAVTAIRAEGRGIVASIRNTGGVSRTTRARLTLAGRAAGDTAVTVGPGASADVEFAVATGSTASTAAVAVDDPGGIPADNVRYAVLDGVSRPTVLIVTATGDLGREAFYAQQALSGATSSGGRYQLTGISPAQLSIWDPARLTPHAAIVLLSTRGLERRGREALAAYIRAGGGLLMAVGPDVDGEVVGDVLGDEARLRITTNARQEDRALTPADVRHPIFLPFGAGTATLSLVTFHTVAQIEGAGCQTVARFTTGEPALLDCTAGDGRALVLASDVDNRWNDFPLHATFVPFLHEAVRYVASGRPQTRDVLVGDAPPGIPATPGIVVMSAPGHSSRMVAVNVDPRESDPTRLSVAEFQAAVTRLKDVGAAEARGEARQQEDRQHLWRYALALMIAALAIESVVASRTA